MADFASSASNNIPAHYDSGMGPVIFTPYAQDLVRRLPQKPGLKVLEVAAGTGRVTREMARNLPSDDTIVATDLSMTMLEVAKESLRDSRVTWQVADALDLPFDDSSFDVVVAQFGAMFYPDKVKGHREARRVLKPGGKYFFSVWCPLSENPWASEVHAAMGELFPENQPMFFMIPFSYGDQSLLRSHLEAAGFESVQITPVEMELRAARAKDLAVGAVEGSSLAASLEERGMTDLGTATDAVTARFVRAFGDNPMVTTMKAFVINSQ